MIKPFHLILMLALLAGCMILKRDHVIGLNNIKINADTFLYIPTDSEWTVENGIKSVIYRFNNQDSLYENRGKFYLTFKEDNCLGCDSVIKRAPTENGLMVTMSEVIFDYQRWPNGKVKVNNFVSVKNGRLVNERVHTDSLGITTKVSQYIFCRDTLIERFGGKVTGWLELNN